MQGVECLVVCSAIKSKFALYLPPLAGTSYYFYSLSCCAAEVLIYCRYIPGCGYVPRSPAIPRNWHVVGAKRSAAGMPLVVPRHPGSGAGLLPGYLCEVSYVGEDSVVCIYSKFATQQQPYAGASSHLDQVRDLRPCAHTADISMCDNDHMVYGMVVCR